MVKSLEDKSKDYLSTYKYTNEVAEANIFDSKSMITSIKGSITEFIHLKKTIYTDKAKLKRIREHQWRTIRKLTVIDNIVNALRVKHSNLRNTLDVQERIASRVHETITGNTREASSTINRVKYMVGSIVKDLNEKVLTANLHEGLPHSNSTKAKPTSNKLVGNNDGLNNVKTGSVHGSVDAYIHDNQYDDGDDEECDFDEVQFNKYSKEFNL